MTLFLFTGLIFLSAPQDSALFKPKEEFEIKLKYEFKQRSVVDNTSVHFSETTKEKERRTTSAMLPYVGLNLNLIKLNPGEIRIKIADNMGQTVQSRKVKQGDIIFINMGFTDDMKDRVTPSKYIVNFLNAEKQVLSQIVIEVNEDGGFFVNHEKRGKF